MGTWQFVSSVSPVCGYKLQRLADYGLIVYSPLPACYSNLQVRPSLVGRFAFMASKVNSLFLSLI